MDGTRLQDSSTAQTTDPTPPASTTDGSMTTSTSRLDRRREKLQSTTAAADAADAAVAKIDRRLDAAAGKRRDQEAALQATLDRVAELKKAVKSSVRESGKVRTSRKGALQAAVKARQRAATAETKYDRAVLADMLRREKEQDLSAHSPTATDHSGDARATGNGRRSSEPALSTRPSTSAGTARATPASAQTARATAARTTASRAHAASPTDTPHVDSGA